MAVAIGKQRRSLSPASSPRCQRGKRSGASLGGSAAEKLVFAAVEAALRRKGVLMVAPLLYVALMLVLIGGWLLESVPERVGVVVLEHPPQGAVYRSPQVFEKLLPFMKEDAAGRSNALMTAWDSKISQRWKHCIKRKLVQTELPPSNGFLIIEANGGLNQQRLSICDAVAVAGLLNSTLVIPMFHFNSVWRDSSKFGDIFDEGFFIDALKNHVRVVKQLPEDVLLRFNNNTSKIINMRAKAYSTKKYYLQKVLPKLLKLGAVRIAPFSNRLAQSVPSNIQGLRCLANYEALRFSQPIRTLAERMVDRMMEKASASGGKYVAIHLRFEEDMVAFSCCTYDGGEEEKHEMVGARERSWRGKFQKPGRTINPEANRIDGKCPLTPLEVGMMLRGMGFDNATWLYMASGKIYNEEKYMASLLQLFPLLETKETLATPEELAPFKGHSSRMAALDYTLCTHSEVFVSTQGGNFPHFLMGQRRYLYQGHAKTIKPDKKKLVLSFGNPNIRWDEFKRNMQDMLHHNDAKGFEQRKPDSSVYSFPMPDCMCQQGMED